MLSTEYNQVIERGKNMDDDSWLRMVRNATVSILAIFGLYAISQVQPIRG